MSPADTGPLILVGAPNGAGDTVARAAAGVPAELVIAPASEVDRLSNTRLTAFLVMINGGSEDSAEQLKLLERVAQTMPDRPVIALVDSVNDAIAERAIAAGADEILSTTGLDGSMLGVALSTARARRARAPASNVLATNARLRLANIRLRRLAHVDPLTALLNRRGLERILFAELARARRRGEQLIAMLVDCDDFKSVNETYGHAIGDAVLVEIADRLQSALRPSDHVARVGGDEFLVLLPSTRIAEARVIAERMRNAIRVRPVMSARGPVQTSVSLGLFPVPVESATLAPLLERGDQALSRSKALGKNRVTISLEGGDEPPTREEILRLLDSPSRLTTVRQAIVRLTDEVPVAYELLTRGPDGPLARPDVLFRAFAEYGVLEQADVLCLSRCLADGMDIAANLPLHVNLFPSTLRGLPTATLLGPFRSTDGRPRICVEVSERELVGDPGQLDDARQRLFEAGVGFVLDDAGFGVGSLEALVLLKPDAVKIDHRFVHDIGREQGRMRSLRRFFDVATALGTRVIAEGIESREDLEALRSIGIVFGQGQLFGLPAPCATPRSVRVQRQLI